MEAETQGRGCSRLAAGLMLVVASLGVIAPAAADDRSSDTWKEARIWTSYALNEHLNPFKLEVAVDKGRAVLTGTVQTDVERDLAIEIARSVNGVEDVESEIVVDPGARERNDAPENERRFGERVSDATTAAAIKSQLLWNKHTDGLQVDVDVDRGRVVVKGIADSDTERELAERIAGNTDGVEDVENRIRVAKKSEASEKSVGETVSDAWLATKVRSVLVWTREVPAPSIDVEVEDGSVTLTGSVDSPAQAELAVELADNVRGVRTVDNRLDAG